MADSRATEILKQGNSLFNKKKLVDSLFQEIAENFYPERADFTDVRTPGDEFADNLFTSFPPLARRELGNLMSSSLRRGDTKWVSLHARDNEADTDRDAREFLEFLSEIHWSLLYQRGSNFVRSTKEGDHDFAAFGNAVIQVTPNLDGDGLLFRNYHLRDCAWSENAAGKVDAIHRNWCPTARQLERLFPDTISKETRNALRLDSEKEIKCRHVVLPSRIYPKSNRFGKQFPYVSVYLECESQTILEEVGQNHFGYVIPRWQTVSGSQYGTSMATSVLLPDGRTMQAVVRTLREAGEKYVDPPMIAVGDAIRGDIPLYAGGITIADMEYDERLGEVLRPVTRDKSGMPIGFDIAEALKADITAGFFLDKIQLPEIRVEMTAFEVRRRIQEQLRSSTPIFEPITEQYNEPLNEEAFAVGNSMGLYPLDEIPKSLNGGDLKFQFRSPLSELAEQEESETFLDTMTRFIIPLSQVDPAQLEQVDITQAARDAMMANGLKAKYFKPIEAVMQRQQQMAEQAEAMQQAEAIGTAGEVAEQGGKGLAALKEAGA